MFGPEAANHTVLSTRQGKTVRFKSILSWHPSHKTPFLCVAKEAFPLVRRVLRFFTLFVSRRCRKKKTPVSRASCNLTQLLSEPIFPNTLIFFLQIRREYLFTPCFLPSVCIVSMLNLFSLPFRKRSWLEEDDCWLNWNFDVTLFPFRLQRHLNRIAEKVNQYLSGCVPVDEKYGA